MGICYNEKQKSKPINVKLTIDKYSNLSISTWKERNETKHDTNSSAEISFPKKIKNESILIQVNPKNRPILSMLKRKKTKEMGLSTRELHCY